MEPVSAPTVQSFWAIVAVDGQRFAAHLSDAQLFGSRFVQADILDAGGCEAFTRYIQASELRSVTPVDEPTARLLAAQLDVREVAVRVWVSPVTLSLPAPKPANGHALKAPIAGEPPAPAPKPKATVRARAVCTSEHLAIMRDLVAHDRPNSEAAAATGLPPTTVSYHMTRLRKEAGTIRKSPTGFRGAADAAPGN